MSKYVLMRGGPWNKVTMMDLGEDAIVLPASRNPDSAWYGESVQYRRTEIKHRGRAVFVYEPPKKVSVK